MQNIPRIELCIADAQLTVSHYRLPDRGPLEVPIPLSELMINGTDEAARKIGALVLQILTLWHKEALANATVHQMTQNPAPELALVDALVQRSLRLKTRVYVPTIEHILNHPTVGSEQACADFADAYWPSVRTELERFDAG